MTAFVILAAGRGTRVGRVGGGLHKSLLPLDGRAVLTHLFELAPPGARLIVCVGHRAEQIRDYIDLAHPGLGVTLVHVDVWHGAGSGPGRSLLAARRAVGDDDMLFTSCDTLWTHTPDVDPSASWAAYAPMPAGTEPRRWCRLDVHGDHVVCIYDKTNDDDDVLNVYTGVAHVARADLPTFWEGVAAGRHVDDELQITGGLERLTAKPPPARRLGARRIDWIDTGDEQAYRRAVATYSGYDWTKTDQTTYVLPRSRRVVKYMADVGTVRARHRRGNELQPAVPALVAHRDNMLAYGYVEGETVYERLEHDDDVDIARRLLEWRDRYLTRRVRRTSAFIAAIVSEFYQHKTIERVGQLREPLRGQAHDAVGRVDFTSLTYGFDPGIPHGDLNYGNVIITVDDEFVGIDWREYFAGRTWFDLRYDVAKLLAGTVVHWGRARRGDFTPWDAGPCHADVIRDYLGARGDDDDVRDVEIIAALSLINSAPLHAEPLDEVLVARGCAWLERLT